MILQSKLKHTKTTARSAIILETSVINANKNENKIVKEVKLELFS